MVIRRRRMEIMLVRGKESIFVLAIFVIGLCLTWFIFTSGIKRFVDGQELSIKNSNITDDQEAVMLSILHNGIGPFLDNPKYASRIYIADKWELRGSNIILAETVNLPNGKGVSLAFRDSGEITIREYCYNKHAKAKAFGFACLISTFTLAIATLCIYFRRLK